MKRIFDCDTNKRIKVAEERGFDLMDMAQVFDDTQRLDFVDERMDYGEERRISIGKISDRTFTVVYTMRGATTWLVTAWCSNRKERARYDNR